jgi:DNA-directed RNA polymerase specialized sigma24 family protein
VARLAPQEQRGDPGDARRQFDEGIPSSKYNRELDEHRPECMKKCMDELSLECLKKCMETISPEERDLIVKNCTLNKNGKEELARTMGLTSNALRLRVSRVRNKLYSCHESCLKQG